MRGIAGACLIAAMAGIGFASVAFAQQSPAQTQQAPIDTGERVVVTGMVPIPDVGEGAPLFTSLDVEQIEAAVRTIETDARRDMRRCNKPAFGARQIVDCKPTGSLNELLACEIEHSNKAANLAFKAARVTATAEDSRRAAARGEADMKAVEDTELARQEAVRNMQNARQQLLETRARLADMLDAKMSGAQGRDPDHEEAQRRKAGWELGIAKPDVPEGLSIQKVQVIERKDKKGAFVLVQGEIHNSNTSAISVPGLSATLLDENGFPLQTQAVSPTTKRKIPAGKSHAFGFEIRPAPQMLKTAIVTFVSSAEPPPRINVTGVICPYG